MPFKVSAKTTDQTVPFEITANTGLTLLEILQNAEIPIKSSCLGKGLCRQCRVKVESGFAPVTENDKKSFAKNLLDQGWRLSCGIRPRVSLEIFFPQSYSFQEKMTVERQPLGPYSFLCDFGTTGVEIAAVDSSGIFAKIHGLNKQVLHGADIMTRLEYSQRNGTEELESIGKTQVLKLVGKLEAEFKMASEKKIILAGNSAVTSFLGGLDVTELAVSPYQPADFGALSFLWDEYHVETLPLMYSFVGGDLFAGLFYLWKSLPKLNDGTEKESFVEPWAFMDVGTNSEILLWDSEKLWISSTPAGPAFEGSSISIGMRAENGAIVNPRYLNGRWNFSVIGGDLPKGICGSALVQAVYESVGGGQVSADGEMIKPEDMFFTDKLSLSQDDVREFQLAKSAIETGLELLFDEAKIRPKVLYLGGAFGEHLPLKESQAIGLLPAIETKALGNTCLKGIYEWSRATEAEKLNFQAWLKRVENPLELALSDRFQEVFVNNMNLDTGTKKAEAL